jgi:hypothetical protein
MRDEALDVAEELHPTLVGRACSAQGAGSGWVRCSVLSCCRCAFCHCANLSVVRMSSFIKINDLASAPNIVNDGNR